MAAAKERERESWRRLGRERALTHPPAAAEQVALPIAAGRQLTEALAKRILRVCVALAPLALL
jgi:hypothetical protein